MTMQPSTEFSTLDTALWIVDSWPGARVFPTDGKVPAHREFAKGTSWKDNATTDPELITAWYTGTNYGIGVTGILTVDSDLEDDGDAARARWGSLLNDAIVWSGHPRRRSFAFAQTSPPTGDGKWFTADGKPGGEVKGSGYVVVPPSPHVSSSCPDCANGPHPYRWRQEGGMHNPLNVWAGPALAKDANPDGGRVEVPEQWLTSGDPCRSVQRILDAATDWTEGGRHTTMTEAQLRVLRLGEQGHNGARAGLTAVYERFRGAVGNDLSRARQAREEFRRALEGAAGRIVADGFTDPLNYGCCGPEPETSLSVEDAVFTATPILAGIRQAAHANYVAPWGVLGACLATVVAETGAFIRLPDYGSANLFVVMASDSAGGKSTSWGVAQRHIVNAGPGPYALRVPNPTGEGLLAAFYEKSEERGKPDALRAFPNVLVYVDEIGQLVASNGRSGSTADSILRNIWSGSGVGTQTAEVTRRRYLPPGQYRCAFVLGAQPSLAGSLLNGAAEASGTAQRWLWMPTQDANIPDDAEGVVPLQWRPPRPSHPVVEYPDHVMAYVKAERLSRGRGHAPAGVNAHATYQRMRVAAAVAILHGTTVVDDLYWEISGHLMDVSDRTRERVRGLIANEARDRARAEGAREVEKAAGHDAALIGRLSVALSRTIDRHHHDPDGCTRRCFTQGALRRYRKWGDEVIDFATQEGLIVNVGQVGHERWTR